MNQTTPTHAGTDRLYELLSRSARRYPDRIAVDFMGQQITYAELDRASRIVSTFLASRGIGPGHRVGFHFHKCIEALICLFGVIHAGVTYVPFDLQAPSSRIKRICKECGITAIIAGALPPGLDGFDWALLAEPSEAELPDGEIHWLAELLATGHPTEDDPRPPEDDVANILYTSGSTGTPKGVMIPSSSLLHYSGWGVETFGLGPHDRIGNHAPYSFDLSTFDIFAAVRAGATMCPFPDAARGHPYRTARFMAQERITVWYCVPWCLVLMTLRGSLSDHDLSHLRHVLFAGEVMPPEHLREMMRAVPHPSYWNLYGPTETNVCTYHRVREKDLARPEGIPIGRPIAETRAWVVDEKAKPVAAGAPGELIVSGPTVFAGYFKDKRGTAKRFVDAPDGQGQAFRTGDIVVRRAEGELIFLNRRDRMVKSRGYRIELAEVEAVAKEHPSVTEVAVVPVKHLLRGTTLTAFVSLRDGSEVSENELVAHCLEHLPRYMVPSRWEIMDRLPRTPHGKIDLTALEKCAK